MLYRSLLPNGTCFGRRAATGLKIALTDDYQAEENSLLTIRKDIILLLCVFHLLPALWRWEWNSDHKIDKRDRPTFHLFKALSYGKSDKEYDVAEKLLFENEITKKYPQFMNHLNKNILPRTEE